MAVRKKKAAAGKGKGKSLAKKKPAGAVAPYDYGDMAGAGLEGITSADRLIPYLSMLQGLSDELKPANGAYIKGAEIGELINTVTKERYDGDVGRVFVAVDRSHQFVEWVPRKKGGGYVDTFAPESDEVAHARFEAEQEKLKFGEFKRDGNDLVETFYLYGFLLDAPGDFLSAQPCTIACTKTKIKPYKQLITRILSVPGAPLFAHQILVRAVPESSSEGDFYNFSFGPAGDDTKSAMISPAVEGGAEFLAACMKLMNEVRAGSVRPDHESARSSEDDGEDAAF